MKTILASAAIAALLPLASIAQTAITSDTDAMTPEMTTQMILDNQGAAEAFAMSNPAEGPADYDDISVMVGDMLPEGVMLKDIPDNDLSYARVNELQVIVNPFDRTVVSIVRPSEDG